jgi:5-oxopent-3-ene-1,2,5-tricarboxylate decarboxylase/2-hydroxyhepta-2,4-diene-1,7-dioate isomerase
MKESPDDMVLALRELPAAAALDVLDAMGYTNVQMKGVRSLIPGQKMVGRAVTMRFVPSRPDLRAQVIGGAGSAEYRAMEMCGPDDVLVMDAMGWAEPSAAGDIKLLRLKQRGAAGVVTDASVRDLVTLRTYGIGVFAAGETNRTMPSFMLPYDVNVAVQCGGVLIMPGDYVTADDGGVVVVPHQLAEEVAAKAREHEAWEAAIKRQLAVEDVSPGKYYPFNQATQDLLRGDPPG